MGEISFTAYLSLAAHLAAQVLNVDCGKSFFLLLVLVLIGHYGLLRNIEIGINLNQYIA